MSATVGSMVTLEITFVDGYACWGIVGGETGFIHISEWSWKRPIPESDIPIVGSPLQAKVLQVFDDSEKAHQPADATFGGRFTVDFVASARQSSPDRNPWRDPSYFRIGDTFHGRVFAVTPGLCADLSHPQGVQCFLDLRHSDGSHIRVGDDVLVRIESINDEILTVALA
ncbi:MAG: hypothetical protein HY296_04890 [Thaumarchaeota archaeon]|nr:hypothetical protein [Nitrososphaerota archaeon]